MNSLHRLGNVFNTIVFHRMPSMVWVALPACLNLGELISVACG